METLDWSLLLGHALEVVIAAVLYALVVWLLAEVVTWDEDE